MNAPNSEQTIGITGWNTELADRLLAHADKPHETFVLSDAADTHIRTGPQVGNDEAFLKFLARAHDVYLEKGDYEEAHRYGVRFYRLEREDLGAPLVSQSGYLLAQEEFAKATTAFDEGNYRRAVNKGVWAATHFGDAIRAGRRDAEDEFYAAAGLTFEANVYYGDLTDYFEKPIFDDCDELGMPRPIEMLTAIRVKAYQEASRRTDTYRASTMLRHAQALEKLGAPVPGMARLAAIIGIKAYMAGEGSLFPEEFIETLSIQAFPEEELVKIRLSAMRHQYDLDYYSATHNNPGRDVSAYQWFAVAADCVELIKLGDEEAKDNLLMALEKQVEAIDLEYFTRAEESGLNVHFDRYAEAELITLEKSEELKQALREKLIAIRKECLEAPDYGDSSWHDDDIRRIDAAIKDFT